MSKHKIENVKIDFKFRQQLEVSRQIELKKIKAETNKLLAAKARTMVMINGIEEDFTEKLKLCPELKLLKNVIDEVKTKYTDKLYAVIDVCVPPEVDEIYLLTERIKDKSLELLDEYTYKIAKYRENLENYIEDKEHQKNINKNSSNLHETSQETDIIKIYNPVDAYDFDEEIDKHIKDLDKTCKNNSIQQSDKEKLISIREDLLTAKSTNFEIKNTILHEYQLLKMKIQSNMELFNQFYEDYFAEYIIYIKNLNKHKKDKFEIRPKEKFQFKSLEAIEEEIKNIKIMSQSINERNYIREQFNALKDNKDIINTLKEKGITFDIYERDLPDLKYCKNINYLNKLTADDECKYVNNCSKENRN